MSFFFPQCPEGSSGLFVPGSVSTGCFVLPLPLVLQFRPPVRSSPAGWWPNSGSRCSALYFVALECDGGCKFLSSGILRATRILPWTQHGLEPFCPRTPPSSPSLYKILRCFFAALDVSRFHHWLLERLISFSGSTTHAAHCGLSHECDLRICESLLPSFHISPPQS